jgi:hypothetical protein
MKKQFKDILYTIIPVLGIFLLGTFGVSLILLTFVVAILIEFKYIIAAALFFVILCQLKIIGV